MNYKSSTVDGTSGLPMQLYIDFTLINYMNLQIYAMHLKYFDKSLKKTIFLMHWA